MRAHYVVHSHSEYLVERFRGPVTLTGLEKLLTRQARDPRIAPHYHTVSDYTQATIRLSVEELRCFTALLCSPQYRRSGVRALVLADAAMLAYASSLASYLADTDLLVRCFQHRSAALQWVTAACRIPNNASGRCSENRDWTHIKTRTTQTQPVTPAYAGVQLNMHSFFIGPSPTRE